jgi:hypothetical protein
LKINKEKVRRKQMGDVKYDAEILADKVSRIKVIGELLTAINAMEKLRKDPDENDEFCMWIKRIAVSDKQYNDAVELINNLISDYADTYLQDMSFDEFEDEKPFVNQREPDINDMPIKAGNLIIGPDDDVDEDDGLTTKDTIFCSSFHLMCSKCFKTKELYINVNENHVADTLYEEYNDVDERICRHRPIAENDFCCDECGGKMFEIDQSMAIPIALLNRMGYTTEFSCEGHLGKPKVGKDGELVDAELGVEYCDHPYIVFAYGVKLPFLPLGWKLEADVVDRPRAHISASISMDHGFINAESERSRAIINLYVWISELMRIHEERVGQNLII